MVRLDPTIEALTTALPPSLRWVVADEEAIRSIRRGVPVARGPRSKLFHRMLSLAGFYWPQLAICVVVSTVRLVLLRACARSSKGSRLLAQPGSPKLLIFVGFGARAESGIFSKFRSACATEPMYINQVDYAQLLAVAPLSYRQLLAGLGRGVLDICRARKLLPKDFVEKHRCWLTFAGLRLPEYALAIAWWRKVKELADVEEAVFLAADTPAFAAINVGIRCRFLQHGLISKSLLMPDFAGVSTITPVEAEYLKRQIGNHVEVRSNDCQPQIIKNRRRTVLVASAKRVEHEMEAMLGLLDLANEKGVDCVIRLFPGEPPERFWYRQAILANRKLTFAEDGKTFFELLKYSEPAYVASWGSTALIDALHCGVIPVTVASPDDQYLEDTVLPIRECCLSWPQDIESIISGLDDSRHYELTLARLQSALKGSGQ